MTKQIFCILILIQSYTGFAQKPANELKAKIDSIVNPYIKQYSIVGMSIGIVDDAKSYTINYGQTAQQNGFPVTDSTMFHIASITKVFTATAIRSEEHTSELQSHHDIVCRLLLEKK